MVRTPSLTLRVTSLNRKVRRAPCELSCLTSQCLTGRRIGDRGLLQSEIATWSEKTNTKQRGVDGHFQLEDARIKLKTIYPKIKT